MSFRNKNKTNYYSVLHTVGAVVSWQSLIKTKFNHSWMLSERICMRIAQRTGRSSRIWCFRQHRTKVLLFTLCQHCFESSSSIINITTFLGPSCHVIPLLTFHYFLLTFTSRSPFWLAFFPSFITLILIHKNIAYVVQWPLLFDSPPNEWYLF